MDKAGYFEVQKLRARVFELEEALRPFVKFRAWARKSDWPADIADDPDTPVYGLDVGDGTALFVRDFDRAAGALDGGSLRNFRLIHGGRFGPMRAQGRPRLLGHQE